MADGVGTFTEAVSVAGATLAPSSQSNSRLTHTIRLKSIVGFQPYSCLDENCFCCIAIILKCLRCEMSNLTRSMKIVSLCGRLCDSQGIDFNGMRDVKCSLSHWDEIRSDVLEKTSHEIKIMSDVFWKKSNVFG